jgi:conjugal transfer pilus assembly protein TraV
MNRTTVKQALVGLAAGLALLLGGCSTSPQYACGAAPGGKCESVTDAYFAAIGKKTSGGKGDAPKATEATARVTQYIPEGIAIRSQPQVLRVWMPPWEDNNGVFHDQGYSYFVADPGEWVLRQNTGKTIYGNGFMTLEHPTDKSGADSTGSSGDGKGAASKKVSLPPATPLSKSAAKGMAQDLLGDVANADE